MLDLLPKVLIAVPSALLALELGQKALATITGRGLTVTASCPEAAALELLDVLQFCVIYLSGIFSVFSVDRSALKATAAQSLVFSAVNLSAYVSQIGMRLDDLLAFNVSSFDHHGLVLAALFVGSLTALLMLGTDRDDSAKFWPVFGNLILFAVVADYALGYILFTTKRKALLQRFFPGAGAACVGELRNELTNFVTVIVSHSASILAAYGTGSAAAFRGQGFTLFGLGAVRAVCLHFFFTGFSYNRGMYMFEVGIAVASIVAGLVLLMTKSRSLEAGPRPKTD